MKTKLFAIMVMAAASMGITTMAQDADVKCENRGCPEQTAGDNNKMYKPQRFTDFAFEGILLDVDQQAKIDEINADVQSRFQGREKFMETKKEKCDKKECDKKECDKKECKKDCDKKECKKGEMRRGAKGPRVNHSDFMKEYVGKVKEVLTPEQYVVFLENLVTMPQAPGRGMDMKHFKGPKTGISCPSKKAPTQIGIEPLKRK